MANQYVSTGHPVMVSTTFDVPGYQVVRYFGLVRGITVRARGVGPQFLASIQQIFGGQIASYISLCEHSREEALQFMLTHAREMGANAVIGMNYDATELGPGIAEVLAYGTAVFVQPYPAGQMAPPPLGQMEAPGFNPQMGR